MTGQWWIQDRRDGRVRLQLRSGDNASGIASVSTHLALTHFQGLTEEQLISSAAANFRLAREAGTFHLSGSFRRRAGTGQWTFDPAPAFLTTLRKYGHAQPTNRELFALAVSDVRGSYVAELEREGYRKVPVSQLVALYSNGISAPYIRSLGDAGYKGLTASQLISLRTNGVDREFIEGLARRGQKNLTIPRLLSLRTNGF